MKKLQGFHEINSGKLRPVYPLLRFANFGVLNSALFSYLPPSFCKMERLRKVCLLRKNPTPKAERVSADMKFEHSLPRTAESVSGCFAAFGG